MRLPKRIAGSPPLLVIFVSLFLWLVADSAKAQEGVAVGKQVSIEYTLTLPDKTEVESNVGEEPLTYTQGSGQLLPALQAAILGLVEGQTKTVTLEPEEAYGPLNPDAFVEVEKALVPEDLQKPGEELVARGPSGKLQRFRVHEIKEELVVLNFNHPLAGKTLTFDVKVVKIE